MNNKSQIEIKFLNKIINNIEEFDWNAFSYLIPKYCPEYFDANKYNWEEFSWAVVEYCPKKLDINKANLENILESYPEFKTMSLRQIKRYITLRNHD